MERVWGGRNLERLYAKGLPPGVAIGESWEVADRPPAVSVIANGPLAGHDLRWLMANHAEELLGHRRTRADQFPLLVKLLDAEQTLSIQVHPPPAAAAKLGGQPKTEMWYVVEAKPGAAVWAGLRPGVSREAFERRLRSGAVTEFLLRWPVRAGDAMFLRSGQVHAIGEGVVIIEVQQNSDTTYRVFDWNRLGTDGRPRPLHVDEALASIDFDGSQPALTPAAFEERSGVRCRCLVQDPLFCVVEYHVQPGAWPAPAGRKGAAILGVVSGQLVVDDRGMDQRLQLEPGQFCVLPASVQRVETSATRGAVVLWVEPGDGG